MLVPSICDETVDRVSIFAFLSQIKHGRYVPTCIDGHGCVLVCEGGKAENELKWHQENSGGGSAGETFFAGRCCTPPACVREYMAGWLRACMRACVRGSHLLRMKIKYLLEIVLAPFNCGPAPKWIDGGHIEL